MQSPSWMQPQPYILQHPVSFHLSNFYSLQVSYVWAGQLSSFSELKLFAKIMVYDLRNSKHEYQDLKFIVNLQLTIVFNQADS